MKRRTSEATDNTVHHSQCNQQKKRKNKKRKKSKNKSLNNGFIEGPHTIVYQFSGIEERNVPIIDSESGLTMMENDGEKNDTTAMEDHLLSSLLYPQSKQWFMENVFRKKAFATRNAPSERTRALIEKYMYGLDLNMLLHQTASERIHVWMKEKVDNDTGGESKIDSFSTDDTKTAMICHRAGASLYFRAPAEMENELISDLGMELGMNWSGTYPHGQNRSEIEVFVSRKGHKTNLHFDFMENFTVQISGIKKWLFKRSGQVAPLRGCTPHYKEHKNIEQQLKLAQSQDSDFIVPSSSEGDEEDGCDEIILYPGDVLYHPAGIWHSVECLEDSISINLSLVGSTYADMIADGVRQMLWQKEEGRSFVTGVHNLKQARQQFGNLLEQFKAEVNKLRVEDFIPASILLPRRLRWDLTAMESILEDMEEEAKVDIKTETRWRRNPLSVMITYDHTNSENEYPSDSESESDSNSDDDANSDCESHNSAHEISERTETVKYYVHFNFGNEEVESLIRVTLLVPKELISAVEFVRRQREAFETGDLEKLTDRATDLLQVLQLNGLISPI